MIDAVVLRPEQPDTPEILALLAERDAHFDRLYAGEDRKPGKVDLGLGRRLVEALEAEARTRGCNALKLEAGILQPEAISLYRSAGFEDGECFGEHLPNPLSIYLKKDL